MNQYPFNYSLEEQAKPKRTGRIAKKAGNAWRSLLTQLGVDITKIEAFLLRHSSNTIEAYFDGLVH